MTTLDLNAYGVTEMSHAEKVAENGGSIIAIACAAITILGAIGYLVDNREKIAEGVNEGLEGTRAALNN